MFCEVFQSPAARQIITITHTTHCRSTRLAAVPPVFSRPTLPVVGWRQLGHHVPQFGKSDLVPRPSSLHELLVQVEGADGVGKLAEIHLEEGGDGVNVLED